MYYWTFKLDAQRKQALWNFCWAARNAQVLIIFKWRKNGQFFLKRIFGGFIIKPTNSEAVMWIKSLKKDNRFEFWPFQFRYRTVQFPNTWILPMPLLITPFWQITPYKYSWSTKQNIELIPYMDSALFLGKVAKLDKNKKGYTFNMCILFYIRKKTTVCSEMMYQFLNVDCQGEISIFHHWQFNVV